MKNTVVILEAGIGGMSFAFERAGFQVAAAYEGDKKAVEIYRKNLMHPIIPCCLSDIDPFDIPDMDILAGQIFSPLPTVLPSHEKQNADLYRFDLYCKINPDADHDFFHMLTDFYKTKYLIFEFKNYAGKITQKEIYTTEKYLYEKALRQVAILISRNGPDANAVTALKGSLREHGKLILCLSDDDLINLIDMKEKNERPTAEYFGDLLDDLLLHLEK